MPGFAAMFMDASSELVHSLLPIFMSSVLGASMLMIGLIEGIAEATAFITKTQRAVTLKLGAGPKAAACFIYRAALRGFDQSEPDAILIRPIPP